MQGLNCMGLGEEVVWIEAETNRRPDAMAAIE